MWDFRAGSGRFCWGNNAKCVDQMMSPFGILIGIGFFVTVLFTHGVVAVKKCPFVPESATACVHAKLE